MNPDLTCSFTHGSHRFFKFYRLLLQDHGKCLTPRAEPGPLGSENHGRRGRYPRQVRRTAEFLSDPKHTSAAGPALIERGQPRIDSTAARASKNAMVPSYARMALCRGLHAPSPGRFRDCSQPVTATRPPPEPSAAAGQPIVLLEQRGTGRTVCSTADGFRLSAVYVPIRVLFQ